MTGTKLNTEWKKIAPEDLHQTTTLCILVFYHRRDCYSLWRVASMWTQRYLDLCDSRTIAIELNGLVQDSPKWLFECFFSSFKSAWIFACALFQLSSKTFPCIFFLPGLHFVAEKNKGKIFKCAQWPQQNRTRAFQPEKQCGRMFFYLIKKHMQKFRHFWRKKNFT